MKEKNENKKQLAEFGRAFALLFNRAFMYDASHPYLADAIDSTFHSLDQLIHTISPVVFILNRDQFYVDEEPLDPRLNVWRIANHFKKAGIESVSAYKGVKLNELRLFLEISTAIDKYPNADAMNKELFRKGVNNIKINHVFYKKVSAEDEVISRETLKEVSPDMLDATEGKARQMFLESIFDSLLMEKFMGGVNLQNILKNPEKLSNDMIESDLQTAKENSEKGLQPGQFLVHQLEAIEQEVEKRLSGGGGGPAGASTGEGTGEGGVTGEGGGGDLSLPGLANALMDMRKNLMEGIEAQKALGIAYSNEEEILKKANELTDKVIIQLIQEEYQSGKTSVPRLAQILARLIPEAEELKRLLPMIKNALIEAGMSQADFMILVQELGNELQSDSLASILMESAEEIGLDGQELIQKIKENPLKSAEMIYLVSEIQKGGGNEEELTELLVNYVEDLGAQVSESVSLQEGEEGREKAQHMMSEIRSNLAKYLGETELKDGVISRLEERLNQRMDEVLDKMRLEWVKAHSEISKQAYREELTVLETLERGVSADDKLGEILKIVREKVESKEIDDNDFKQIYSEISKQDNIRNSDQEEKFLPAGILHGRRLMTIIDKEISRANRYGTPLSFLGFSLVTAKAKAKSKGGKIRTQDVIDALLLKLAEIFRTSDILGEFRKNQLIALLPMTKQSDGQLALNRVTKILNLELLEVNGIQLEIKVAAVLADPNFKKLTSSALMEQLGIQLSDMTTRLKNIHAY